MSGHRSLVPLVATVHLKTQHELLQHSVFAYKYPSTCTQCFVIDRFHCTTRSPQQQLHVCSRLHVLVQATHAHAYIPDSLLQILYTVTQSYIHDQDAQDCELYCCTSTKRRCTCMKVYTCMPQQTHCTVHLQFCKLHDHTIICAQYGLQTQQSNHTPTTQLSTTA